MTITLHVTDDLSGLDLNGSSVQVTSPTSHTRDAGPLQLTSGDAADGTYTVDVSLPRYSAQGTWTVETSLADVAGNQAVWHTSDLTGAGFPGSFQQTGAGDSSAPVLTSFQVSPSQIDTSGSGKTVTITLHATDDLSGLDPNGSSVTVNSPTGLSLDAPTLQLSSGTSTNGTYTTTVNVPRYSAPGTWSVDLVLADDVANEASWPSGDLIDAGFPGGFDQTGAGDSAAPQLTAFSVAPGQVDSTQGVNTVTVTLHATDALSGVDLSGSQVHVTAADGQPANVGPLQLTSGSPTNGTYAVDVTVPAFSVPGTWELGLTLSDQAGNQIDWSTQELLDAGFDGTFEVLGITPN